MKKRDCTIPLAKTKALISSAVTDLCFCLCMLLVFPCSGSFVYFMCSLHSQTFVVGVVVFSVFNFLHLKSRIIVQCRFFWETSLLNDTSIALFFYPFTGEN